MIIVYLLSILILQEIGILMLMKLIQKLNVKTRGSMHHPQVPGFIGCVTVVIIVR